MRKLTILVKQFQFLCNLQRYYSCNRYSVVLVEDLRIRYVDTWTERRFTPHKVFFLDYELSYSTCIIKFDSCVDKRFGPETGIYSLIFKIVFVPLFFERELYLNYPDMTRKDLPFAAIPYSVPIFICKKIVVRMF